MAEWAGADWWTYVDCVSRNAPLCDNLVCYDDVLQWTCDGYDTFGDDFYTCFATDGIDCQGMINWAIENTDEDYWTGNADYDYATWLYEPPTEPTSPVVFSFNFDPAEVNAWLEEQEGLYDAFNTRYTDEWNAYFDRVVPIYQQIDGENQALQRNLEELDVLTEEQLNSTFYDIGAWFEDSFSADEMYLSLAAKVERKSSQISTMLYAGAFIATLAVISAFIYANRKKEEKTSKIEQMQEGWIASAN